MALSDSQVKSLVTNAVQSGIGGAEIAATLIANGVSQSQAASATGLGSDVITQAYQGALASPSGQNLITQALTSEYRQELGRNPTQEEYQYFQSLAQANPLNNQDLRSAVQAASVLERSQKGITGNQTQMQMSDFEADPFGGRFGTQSIYNLPADAVNVSTINGQRAQFVNPITQLGVISTFNNKGVGTTNKFTDAQVAAYLKDNAYSNPAQVNEAMNMFGISNAQLTKATELLAKNDPSVAQATATYQAQVTANPQVVAQNAQALAGASRFSATPGVETMSIPRINEAVDRAFKAGSLTQSEYNQMLTSMTQATNPADVRKALATPQGSVVIDALYGQQTGEANDLNAALAEARQRQAVLTQQDPGYYQSNEALSRAYQAAGLTAPFQADAYRANTMQTQANQVNPQNFNQRINELLSSLNQQFGSPQSAQTPLTGQYYSESGLQPSFTAPSARTLQPLTNPATISSAVDKFLATTIPNTAPTTAPIAPVATTPSTTFRSGVAGYIPQSALPTGFQFGTPLVNAAPQTYQPGAFQPADVTTGGFITGFNANQQPIYSTYNDPNVNVGGVLSTMNPFVNQGAQFTQLMADYNARQAADLARINSGSAG